MIDTAAVRLDSAGHPFLGWALGWAFATTAVAATGGTAGWTQSPPASAALGIALGAAGMAAGAWWSRGRREAAFYGAAFIAAAAILKLGLLGDGMFSFAFAAGLVGLIGASAGRPFHLGRSLRWGVAFAAGALLLALAGPYLSHFVGVLAEWITGLPAADTAGNLAGAALAGGLCGALAALIGDSQD